MLIIYFKYLIDLQSFSFFTNDPPRSFDAIRVKHYIQVLKKLDSLDANALVNYKKLPINLLLLILCYIFSMLHL